MPTRRAPRMRRGREAFFVAHDSITDSIDLRMGPPFRFRVLQIHSLVLFRVLEIHEIVEKRVCEVHEIALPELAGG